MALYESQKDSENEIFIAECTYDLVKNTVTTSGVYTFSTTIDITPYRYLTLYVFRKESGNLLTQIGYTKVKVGSCNHFYCYSYDYNTPRYANVQIYGTGQTINRWEILGKWNDNITVVGKVYGIK